LVDDESVVRQVARAALEKHGFTVLMAEDGNQAIELLRTGNHGIGLVLLDMTMPGLSGVETFAEMRTIRPDIPVIASSGFNEAEVLARFGEGIAGYVQKPYTADQLAAKVTEIMASMKTRSTGSGAF